MTINVYTNTDTEEKFSVTKNDLPFNLDSAGITRVVVYVCNTLAQLVSEENRQISSDTDSVSWVADELTIKFGRLNVQPGNYNAKVLLIDGSNPNGFVIDEIPIKVVC